MRKKLKDMTDLELSALSDQVWSDGADYVMAHGAGNSHFIRRLSQRCEAIRNEFIRRDQVPF